MIILNLIKVGNHDMMRIASRVGEENINLVNALNLLLGGTAVVYNGEEIGMVDLPRSLLKFEDCQDESGIKFGVNIEFQLITLKRLF